MADLRRELNNQEEQLRAAQTHLKTCKQAVERHKREAVGLKVAMQRLEDRREELENALDKETVEDGRLDVLRTTLEEAEEERRINEGSLQDSTAAMDSMMRTLKEIKQRLAAKDADINKLKEEVRVAQSEELKVKDRRRKIISEKNAAIERINDRKRVRDRIYQERETVKARIVDFSEKASLVSPRVPIEEGETAASLDKKLDRLHRDLERYNQE
jgi:chromosome segregation ATPase